MAAYIFSNLRELLQDQETPEPNVFEGFPPLPSSHTNFSSYSETLREELESNKGSLANSFSADDNDGTRRAAADTEAAMNGVYAEEGKKKGFKKKERASVYAKFDENIGKYVLDEVDVPKKAGLKGEGNGCVKLYFSSPDEEDDEGKEEMDVENSSEVTTPTGTLSGALVSITSIPVLRPALIAIALTQIIFK